MKTRLKDYIEMIFSDAPVCARTEELKEEMYANVCDKYEDLIAEGKSETAAYNACVASIGDISELIDSIREEQKDFTPEGDFDGEEENGERYFTLSQQEEIRTFRKKAGIMNAIAIALYMLCWVPLVLMSSLAEALGGNADVWSTVGVVVMMVIIAVATGLQAMKSYIRPIFLKKKIKKSEKIKKRKNPALRAISSGLWTITVVAYLLMGFLMGLWHPGWIIFIIATAIDNAIEAIFEIAGKKYL